ncbi:potassium channel, subfamily K, member 16-like [Antedon mediterranea]|uniref:potassium channel, subfamily K, member 16-like n=1 Tax=Antedon mediterranea TaxID=105859 RepID=UPI003AF52A0A
MKSCIGQLLLLAFLLLLYLLSGTLVFSLLEKPYEIEVIEDFKVYVDELYASNRCINPNSLRELSAIFGRANQGLYTTIDISSDNNTFFSSWEVPDALFFSFSAISTIGYGNIVPQTSGGRLFCIFYSILGIPIVIAVGSFAGYGITTLHRKCAFRLVGKFKLENKSMIIFCNCLIASVIILIGIVPPSMGFASLYKFGTFEMFYFTFVTMSTIGFGDFVPEADPSWDFSYRLLLCVAMISWCTLLIAAFTLLFGFVAGPHSNRKKTRKKKAKSRSTIQTIAIATVHSPVERNTESLFNI